MGKVYFHCECVIGKYNFVDDMELIVDLQEKKIDFKSGSRVGYSDLKVNRKRMMELIKNLKKHKLVSHYE